MSTKRNYHFVTDARIHHLKQISLKKKTLAKVNWAVKAYVDWRNERLYKFKYDIGIYEADIEDLKNLTKSNFQHALCHFIPEVTKVKGEGLYPARTLYQMIIALQKYLVVNKLYWRLIEDREFSEVKVVLDNIMKEHTQLNIGVKKSRLM